MVGVDLRALFGPILGDWSGIERLEASPWSAGGEARAAMSVKLDVGDRIVVQTYRQVRADGTEFAGHGVFSADESGAVHWWLFDSAEQQPTPAVGEWDGDALTLVKTTPRGTATHHFWRVEDDLAYRVVLDLGAGEVPFLAGRYRAVSTH